MSAKTYALAFLINPISGGGEGRRVYRQLPEIMNSFGFEPDLWTAELTREKEMAQQTQRLLGASQKLIAVGGDGTMGLVIQHLASRSYDAQIGLIPLGTGNDLGRALGIYQTYRARGLIACIKRLIRASATPVDLWALNGTRTLAAYFSLGVDGAVLHHFDQLRRQGQISPSLLGNRWCYLKLLWIHRKYRIPAGVQLEVHTPEGKKEISLKNAVCCLVGNINSYAGGAAPFPRGNFSDGLLDVAVFRSFWQYFWTSLLTRLTPGILRWLPFGTEYYQVEKTSLRGLVNEYCQCDGEDVSSLASPGKIDIEHRQVAYLMDLRRPPFEIFQT